MQSPVTTRRNFLVFSTSIAALLAGCGVNGGQQQEEGSVESGPSSAVSTASAAREAISDSTNGGHAIAVSGEQKSYASVDVAKTGDDDGDEADFYGTNAAVYAEEGATLDLDDVSVTSDGAHANAVFSYGEGTVVSVSNSVIETTGNCSGAVMVTGGGTLTATDVTAHTTGNSSAPIRSDRGGGTQRVVGGSYTSEGTGSPVVYSTADVTVEGAALTSMASQGIVVEGKNSVRLKDCTLSASNTTKNSDKSDWFQAVMIYQSMSGDAAQGAASFQIEGGSVSNANGDVFFVNNTVATIDLAGATITNGDANGVFLRAAAAGWGSEGSNGGQVTLNATGQEISGDMVVDEDSTLNLYLKDMSSFVGAINRDGAAGDVYVEVADGCTWELAADSHVSALTCAADGIALNGYVLMVGDEAYVEGSASAGEAVQAKVSESTGGPGQGGEPPEKPGEDAGREPGSSGGEPPAKPDGEMPAGAGGEPPARPANS